MSSNLSNIKKLNNPQPRKRGRPPKNASFCEHPAGQMNDNEEHPKSRKSKKENSKEENYVDSFVKILPYFKHIEYKEAEVKDKNNPYALLTPTVFWFIIEAEYFKDDFLSVFKQKNRTDHLLKNKIRLPINIPLRLDSKRKKFRGKDEKEQ